MASPQYSVSIASSAKDGGAWTLQTGTWPPSGTGTQGVAWDYYPATDTVLGIHHVLSGSDYQIDQAFVKFDTSAIPDEATVTDAYLEWKCAAKVDTNSKSIGAQWYVWNENSSNKTLFDQDHIGLSFSPDAYAGQTLASTTVGTTYQWTLLNPASNVSKTGNTGLRISMVGSTTPTGNNRIQIYSFDHSTEPEPKLVITYTMPNQETLRPTSVQLTSLSGAVADIDDDPEAPDSAWLTGANPVGITNGPEYPNARAGATGQTAFTWDGSIANATDTSDSTSTTDATTTTTKADYFTIPATGFNDTPSTATITGFSVDIKHQAGTANRVNVFLQLGTANGTLIGSEQTAVSNLATTAGGVTHTVSSWGVTPTRAQLIAGTFGIRVRVTRSPTSAYTFYSIKATATYDDTVTTEARVAMSDPVGTLATP